VIIDTLSNNKLYTMFNLDRYLDWVSLRIQSPLTSGREELDNGVYALVCNNQTSNEAGQFETHEKYIDVHVIIKGFEKITYAPIKSLSVVQEYEAEADVAFYTGEDMAICNLREGMFMVLFPDEGHIPNLRYQQKETNVCKIVLKIPIHLI